MPVRRGVASHFAASRNTGLGQNVRGDNGGPLHELPCSLWFRGWLVAAARRQCACGVETPASIGEDGEVWRPVYNRPSVCGCARGSYCYKGKYLSKSSNSPLVTPIFYIRIGFRAKFRFRGSISELIYILINIFIYVTFLHI